MSTAQKEEQIVQIIDALRELHDDASVPRNIKLRIERTITALGERIDLSIRVDKAQQELENISDDSNLQSFTRAQIWNVVSLLEKI